MSQSESEGGRSLARKVRWLGKWKEEKQKGRPRRMKGMVSESPKEEANWHCQPRGSQSHQEDLDLGMVVRAEKGGSLHFIKSWIYANSFLLPHREATVPYPQMHRQTGAGGPLPTGEIPRGCDPQAPAGLRIWAGVFTKMTISWVGCIQRFLSVLRTLIGVTAFFSGENLVQAKEPNSFIVFRLRFF